MTLLTDLEDFSLELCGAAAEVAVPIFRAGCGHDDKGRGRVFDPVTQADRDAEAAIRRRIAARFPDHGVIGEEYGEDRPNAEWVWILDPIDGTRAFISGLPLWTTLVALRHQKEVVVGTVAAPALGEVFCGGASGAVRLRDGVREAIRCRPCPRLGAATLSTTDPALFQGPARDGWSRLEAATRLTRLGCDAYAYAMVAAGRMDLVAEAGLKPWDWAAPMALVRAAGGRVQAWDGQEPNGESSLLAVGDPALFEPARALLAG
ncbi:MAG: histidinol-phosphatase [Caulobacterales bacterium]|nr:histidinol-phosphatase [Caulobacterales bacterium]